MLLRQEGKRNRRAAFTLMEMLIVVAIIVALAGIGGYYLIGALTQSQQDTAMIRAKGPLSNAVMTYYTRHHTWPPNLQVLLQPDQKGNPPILEDMDALTDPWGGQFQYNPAGPHHNGRRPDIWAQDPQGRQWGNWSNN